MTDAPSMTSAEWRARPTMAMMTCLRRMQAENGKLVRVPNGWKVVSTKSKNIGVLFWFPASCGNGLVNRGLVGADGYLTKQGIAAMERYR